MRQLPTEILDLILEQTARPVLCEVLRVNRFFHTLALRTLYEAPRDGPCDSWPTLSTRQQIVLLRTLTRNSSLQQLPKPNTHVRSLRLDFTDHAVAPNLVRLIHRALRTTPGLRELDIQFSAFDNYHKFSWCLTGCTFNLQRFKTSIYYDQKLVDFLATQPHIKELSLNGLVEDPIPSLPPDALPRLQTLRNAHIEPNAIAQFFVGRPVEAASLTLPSENWCETLDALTSGSVPLQRVTLLCLDSICADTLVAELAGRLPNLLAFHAVFFLSLMPHEKLIALASDFASFRRLRYVTLMGPDSRTVEEERKIVAAWSDACPTLTTIILPLGQVWHKRLDGNWHCFDDT